MFGAVVVGGVCWLMSGDFFAHVWFMSGGFDAAVKVFCMMVEGIFESLNSN